MEGGNLNLRDQLHCVQCVFTILSGQGSSLNLDPYRSVLKKTVHIAKKERSALTL